MLKLYLAGGILAALLAGWLYVSHLRSELSETRAELKTASAQAASNEAGQHIEARRSTNTRKAQQTAEEGRDAVQNSQTPDDVLLAWSDAIDRVREQGHGAVTGADGS